MTETSNFLANARENGVSYALVKACEDAKRSVHGSNFSASQNTIHERTIRALVSSYGTDEIAPGQLADILTVLHSSPKTFNPILSEAVTETLPAELNVELWAKSITQKERLAINAAKTPTPVAAEPAPTPEPTPEPVQTAEVAELPVVELPADPPTPAPAPPTPAPLRRSGMFGARKFAGV